MESPVNKVAKGPWEQQVPRENWENVEYQVHLVKMAKMENLELMVTWDPMAQEV